MFDRLKQASERQERHEDDNSSEIDKHYEHMRLQHRQHGTERESKIYIYTYIYIYWFSKTCTEELTVSTSVFFVKKKKLI